jgi:hypothetical protein
MAPREERAETVKTVAAVGLVGSAEPWQRAPSRAATVAREALEASAEKAAAVAEATR